MIIEELNTNGIVVKNNAGQEEHISDLAWVEGSTNSVAANQQIKLALANQRPVFFHLDEGGQRLTPFEFAERIDAQISACLAGIRASLVAEINFVYQPLHQLSQQEQAIINRRIHDVLTDLFGANIATAQVIIEQAA
ncbi:MULTISPECIES: hypothetical protein [Limosilactobacillus]|jgi:hypothetical protein|uniref:hypothetical protein n=1 Tax=Limosilactobacillus TaxID=2742598 RepID=UPI002263E596|nr:MULTISPECIES: hypothetical protein [Limosilactobacillus]MCH3922627.1 hypothetical protein [Limosilactobacillus sp.]MCH3927310.1 hypothetical protein [Limosilactobacillus sp.]